MLVCEYGKLSTVHYYGLSLVINDKSSTSTVVVVGIIQIRCRIIISIVVVIVVGINCMRSRNILTIHCHPKSDIEF